jgi:hypothetical protein
VKSLQGIKYPVSQVLKTTQQLQLDCRKPVDQLEYRVIMVYDKSSYISAYFAMYLASNISELSLPLYNLLCYVPSLVARVNLLHRC